MFNMNKFWERFFYLLTFLTQGASFLNPRAYAILHRRHHSYSDKEKDPHSPHQSKNLMDMMLNTYGEYKFLLKNKKVDLSDIPQWRALDNIAESKWNVYAWIPVYPIIYFLMGIDPLLYLFLPLHYFMGPIQGAIVNWFGHKVGYRNFELGDYSKNTLPIDFLLMGELYQNNHHQFSKRMNFAYRWFELDLTYVVAKVLDVFGIIKSKEVRP